MIGTDIAWLMVPLAYDLDILGRRKRPDKKKLGVLGPYLTRTQGGFMNLFNGMLRFDEASPIEVEWSVKGDGIFGLLSAPTWSCKTHRGVSGDHVFKITAVTGDEDKMRTQLTLLRVFIHGYVPR